MIAKPPPLIPPTDDQLAERHTQKLIDAFSVPHLLDYQRRGDDPPAPIPPGLTELLAEAQRRYDEWQRWIGRAVPAAVPAYDPQPQDWSREDD